MKETILENIKSHQKADGGFPVYPYPLAFSVGSSIEATVSSLKLLKKKIQKKKLLKGFKYLYDNLYSNGGAAYINSETGSFIASSPPIIADTGRVLSVCYMLEDLNLENKDHYYLKILRAANYLIENQKSNRWWEESSKNLQKTEFIPQKEYERLVFEANLTATVNALDGLLNFYISNYDELNGEPIMNSCRETIERGLESLDNALKGLESTVLGCSMFEVIEKCIKAGFNNEKIRKTQRNLRDKIDQYSNYYGNIIPNPSHEEFNRLTEQIGAPHSCGIHLKNYRKDVALGRILRSDYSSNEWIHIMKGKMSTPSLLETVRCLEPIIEEWLK